MPEDVLPLPPGAVLQERYRIERFLENDGVILAYRGRDLYREEDVTVAEFAPFTLARREGASLTLAREDPESGLLYTRGLARFMLAALAAARVERQPAVIGVRHFFQANNTGYYVADYAERCSLRAYLEQKGGRIPPEELFPLAEPAFGALAAFHRAGRYGAEFSPRKIMVENGGLRLPAFHWGGEEFKDTWDQGSHQLSPFLPLERIPPGKKRGPWTDVYSLAAMLSYCLTGAEPPDVFARLGKAAPDFPDWPGAALTPGQKAALRKALELKAVDRFQSPEEMREALYSAPAAKERKSRFGPFRLPWRRERTGPRPHEKGGASL